MAIIQSENNRVLVRPQHLKGGLIRAQPGTPLHVRIHADLSPAYAMPEGVFDLDSAFPRRGVFGYLRSIATQIAPLLEPRVTLFGHADQSGGELHNKGLSERRAKVVYAMLTGELELFTEVAEDEFWSTPTYQRMLNLLGCNAGKADGIKGPKTRAAFKTFQKDYNALLYHLNYNGRTRAYDELTVDGIFGDRTRDAMHDAYLSKVPFTLDPATFTSTPFAGCSEFNRRGDDAKQNRRVTLALWKGDLPLDSKFPCKEGDPQACPVHPESKTPHRRCKFYRFFVDKEQELQSRITTISTRLGIWTSTFAHDETRNLTGRFSEHRFVSWMAQVFGRDVPVDAYQKLFKELEDGAFPQPRFEVTDEIPDDHLAAYNRTAGRIELHPDLIPTSEGENLEAQLTLMAALLEEFGHHIDHQLRTRLSSVGGDAQLDEGAAFGYAMVGAFWKGGNEVELGTFVFGNQRSQVVVQLAEQHAYLDEVLGEWAQRDDARSNHREYFGAVRGDDNGHSFGHESIEDALDEPGLFQEKWERQEIYFGNWLRDHSQALTGLSLRPPGAGPDAPGHSAEALAQVLGVLARQHFDDTPVFKVTQERLGVYRYEEHIDNPKGLTDDRGIDARLNQAPIPSQNQINPTSWLMRYIDQDVAGHPCALSYMQEQLRMALHLGRTSDGRRHFGQALHVLEDFYAHSNFVELALRASGHPDVFPFSGKTTVGTQLITPLVTGMFGGADTGASILYLVAEHMQKHADCTPGNRGPGADIALILLKDSDPEQAKQAEVTLSKYEDFQKTNPTFFRFTCQTMDFVIGQIGRSLGHALHSGSAAIDDAQTLFINDLKTSLDPTHTQLAKDHDDHPLHSLAANCAKLAVATVGKSMVDAWSGSLGEQTLLTRASNFFVHPFNRRQTRTSREVQRVFDAVTTWARSPANNGAIERLKYSNILEYLTTSQDHAHARTQTRNVIREGQKLRHSVRPETDDGPFDSFLEMLHELVETP